MKKKKALNLQAERLLLQKKNPIMVSACLLGICCRYDGKHSLCSDLLDFVSSHPFLPLCPEQLGGLPTPRFPADIKGGDGYDVLSGNARLINTEGKDVTDAFKNGAEKALKLIQLAGVEIAIMKDKSPSCGLKTPYCEKPNGAGVGVTAACLRTSGIRIIELGSDDTFSFSNILKLMNKH